MEQNSNHFAKINRIDRSHLTFIYYSILFFKIIIVKISPE